MTVHLKHTFRGNTLVSYLTLSRLFTLRLSMDQNLAETFQIRILEAIVVLIASLTARNDIMYQYVQDL
jgi:hypothetical protein